MKDLTPKDKAKELVDRFYHEMNPNAPDCNISFRQAKQCAIIAVQNIICANPHSNPLNTDSHSTMGWWKEVKQEIEKL